MTSAELAWLGGLLEAEGSFMIGTPSQPRTPRLMIGMTDQDIIQRVSFLIGSSIKQFRINQVNLKPQYSVQVGGGSAISLMSLLLPLMGQRRQGQIERAMSCYTLTVNYPRRTYCLSDEPNEAVERRWLAGYLEGEGHFALRKFENHY